MRVLMLNNFVHLTGGADRHCFTLARELRRRGHDVAFLATMSEEPEETQGVFIEATVTHDSRGGLPLDAQARVAAKALWNGEAARATNCLLDEFRPDVVHAHKLYPQLSVSPIVAAHRRGVPLVQTLHDFEFVGAAATDARGGLIDRDEERFSYRLLNSATLPIRRWVHVPRISHFIAVSRFLARIYEAHGVRATVLPNFVVPRPSDLGFHERAGIAFLGRLRPEKGVLDVVELAKLLPETPISIIGFGGLEPVVREEGERLPNLTVTGFIPDEERDVRIAGARVVVIPSRCQDAGPLAPLEAMAAGTPVVAYSNGGLAEYVASAGGRVTPPDPLALAVACRELHDDETAWQRASARARAAVAEQHSLERYVDRLEQIYQQLN